MLFTEAVAHRHCTEAPVEQPDGGDG